METLPLRSGRTGALCGRERRNFIARLATRNSQFEAFLESGEVPIDWLGTRLELYDRAGLQIDLQSQMANAS